MKTGNLLIVAMTKSNFALLCAMIVACIFSCADDNTVQGSGDPANLTLETIVAEDDSGHVQITATADNAVEYQFDTGESGSETIINKTGVLTHTYSLTGVYLVEVKAYGKSGRFVRKSTEITVRVGKPGTPIQGADGYITPLDYAGMMLVWQDEFSGSALSEAKWNYEIGTGSDGWGNNELQYYRRENTSVTDGFLVIEAKKEAFNGRSYTSSRLTTQNKFDFQYGRVDIRAKLPRGQGIWPALWMLGKNFGTVGWPRCGEIDIMEMIGGGKGRDDVTHGTIHWDNNGTKDETGGKKQLSSGIFNDKFFVFSIVWNASGIKWYLDDQLFHTTDITPADLSEFRNGFFFIFNVAVGGNWPGSPNSGTLFPQEMVVDYVRVFQDN